MTTIATTPATPTNPTVSTRARLAAGAVAAPLWAAVSLGQAATRDGFDLTRHPLSLLSTGSLGWLQIVNFVLAGALLVAGAGGLHQVLRGTPGGTWVPRLVRISGFGLIAAGVLVMDPADGFPIGTPAGMPASMSWHSIGHMVAGSICFTALIAACYTLVRHFRATGQGRRAVAAGLAGTALLVGDAWAMSGGAAGTLTLAAGAITAMLFVSLTAAWYRGAGSRSWS
jgi:hypothetical protein